MNLGCENTRGIEQPADHVPSLERIPRHDFGIDDNIIIETVAGSRTPDHRCIEVRVGQIILVRSDLGSRNLR
jgi:hypothetical protein